MTVVLAKPKIWVKPKPKIVIPKIEFIGHAHVHDHGSPLDGGGTSNQYSHAAVQLEQTHLGRTNHGRLGTALEHLDCCRHPENYDNPFDPGNKRLSDERLSAVIGEEFFWRPDVNMDLPKFLDDGKTIGPYGKNPHNWAQHLCLHARNLNGWHTLMRLSSKSWVRRENGGGFYGKACIDMNMLRDDHEDIVVSTACVSSPVSQLILAGDEDGAYDWCVEVIEIVGHNNFFFEIMPHDLDIQRTVNIGKINIANRLGSPYFVTGDVHMPYREWCVSDDETPQASTHSVVRMAAFRSSLKSTEKKKDEGEDTYTEEIDSVFLSSGEQLFEMFQKNHPDLPVDVVVEGLNNTKAFFSRFRGYVIGKDTKLPEVKGVNVQKEIDKWLAAGRKRDELNWRKDGLLEPEIAGRHAQYDKQLAYEYGVLKAKGVFPYFYLVGNGCRWMDSDEPLPGDTKKKRRIRFTTRGSAAGSLFSYRIGIVKIDPIQHNLKFERFLNPDRVGLPDIDLDVESHYTAIILDDGTELDGRSALKEYFARIYGRDHVADIIAYQTFAPKAVIKAVSETFDLIINRDIQPILDSIGDTERGLEKIAANNPIVAKFKEDNPEIWTHCLRLEDQKMRDTRHAAGLLITPKPISELMPTQLGSDEISTVTAFSDTADFPVVSDYGFIKLDVLGVKGLGKQQMACDLIEANHGIRVDLDDLPPLRNPRNVEAIVMEKAQVGQTLGVFQSSGRGYTQGLRKLNPQDVVDLTAFNAIYRPGPIRDLDRYIDRHNGNSDEPEAEWYWHERVKPVLEDTFGVVAFQEQLMEVCIQLANFSGGQADGMRKGVSKWYRLGKDRCIEKLREAGFEKQWMKGCQQNGLTKDEAWAIWDALLDWAAYGFNRSHAACYAIQGYQDMWIKTYYPHEFYAALLTLEKKSNKKKKGGGEEKAEKVDEQAEFVKGVIREARALGVEVAPPDINLSDQGWSIVNQKILFGLASLKDVGGSAAFGPISEYRPFKDYDDFIMRMPSDFSVRKGVALVKAGAFDRLDNRVHLLSETRSLAEGKAQFSIKMTCGCAKGRTIKFEDEEELEDKLGELESLTCSKPNHEDGEVTEINERDPFFTIAEWKKEAFKKHETLDVEDPEITKVPTQEDLIDYEREVLKIPLSVANMVASYTPFMEEKIHTEIELADVPLKPKRSRKGGKTQHGSSCPCSACEAAEVTVGGEIARVKVITTKNKEQMAFVDFIFGTNQYNVTFFPYLYRQVASLLKRHTAFLVAGHKDGPDKIIANDIMDVIDIAKDQGWEPPVVKDELAERRAKKRNPWSQKKSKKPKIRKVA